jgi:hypothetical protein
MKNNNNWIKKQNELKLKLRLYLKINGIFNSVISTKNIEPTNINNISKLIIDEWCKLVVEVINNYTEFKCVVFTKKRNFNYYKKIILLSKNAKIDVNSIIENKYTQRFNYIYLRLKMYPIYNNWEINLNNPMLSLKSSGKIGRDLSKINLSNLIFFISNFGNQGKEISDIYVKHNERLIIQAINLKNILDYFDDMERLFKKKLNTNISLYNNNYNISITTKKDININLTKKIIKNISKKISMDKIKFQITFKKFQNNFIIKNIRFKDIIKINKLIFKFEFEIIENNKLQIELDNLKNKYDTRKEKFTKQFNTEILNLNNYLNKEKND